MGFFSRIISFFLIIFLFPVFFLLSLLCLLFQGIPIFYRQERIGYNFKKFKIYKFRTMKNELGTKITYSNDNRITVLGNFLRKYKIDETPQLFNILKGEMRFIGPRPEIPEYFDKEKFYFLKKIKPGISDFASILFRNEEEILLKIGGANPYRKLLPLKIQLANYYSQNKSFLLDLNLIFLTVFSIFFPRNASNLFIIPKIKKYLPDSIKAIQRYLNY